jgi:hypothetical protein
MHFYGEWSHFIKHLEMDKLLGGSFFSRGALTAFSAGKRGGPPFFNWCGEHCYIFQQSTEAMENSNPTDETKPNHMFWIRSDPQHSLVLVDCVPLATKTFGWAT